jgi:hypothetical protein
MTGNSNCPAARRPKSPKHRTNQIANNFSSFVDYGLEVPARASLPWTRTRGIKIFLEETIDRGTQVFQRGTPAAAIDLNACPKRLI